MTVVSGVNPEWHNRIPGELASIGKGSLSTPLVSSPKAVRF